MLFLCCYYCSVLVNLSDLTADDSQEVGLQGPDKEAPTSRSFSRINNEPSRPTGRVRFCLPRSSSLPLRETLFDQTPVLPYSWYQSRAPTLGLRNMDIKVSTSALTIVSVDFRIKF